MPLILDQAKSDEDKAALKILLGAQGTGRPYAVSPTTPADITATLRDGFDKTMVDPDFIQFAAKMRLDLQPVKGVEMQKMIADIYASNANAVERAKAVIK